MLVAEVLLELVSRAGYGPWILRLRPISVILMFIKKSRFFCVTDLIFCLPAQDILGISRFPNTISIKHTKMNLNQNFLTKLNHP